MVQHSQLTSLCFRWISLTDVLSTEKPIIALRRSSHAENILAWKII